MEINVKNVNCCAYAFSHHSAIVGCYGKWWQRSA